MTLFIFKLLFLFLPVRQMHTHPITVKDSESKSMQANSYICQKHLTFK